MRALIWVIGLFALAVGVAMIAGLNDGYILMVLSPWRVQISLNLFIVLLVAGVVLLHLLTGVVGKALALPARVSQWRDRRRRDKAESALQAAVNALFGGRYPQALKSATAAHGASGGGVTAALVAARAAHALQDETRYREWLGQAEGKGPEAELARLMTEAELALEERRFDVADARLEALRAGGHDHVAVLQLASRVALAFGRWDELVRVLRQLRKLKAVTPERAAPMLRRAHLERMKQLAAEPAALAAYWQEMSGEELQDAGLVEQALPLLVQAGQQSLVRRQVERLLDERWHSGLARQYALCADSDADARRCLQKAEDGWLLANPADAGLLFALGQLCRRLALWGKAQSYLEASLQLAPALDTHLALAHLFEALERPADAQRHYRVAAEMVAGGRALLGG